VSGSLSFAFGDARAERYGVVGLDPEEGAFALLFAGRETVLAAPAPGLSVTADGAGWHVELGGDGAGLALGFAPLAAAVATPAGGSDQPCRVTGSVRAGGRTLGVTGVGQHSRAPGGPDWDRIELTRAVAAWTELAAASLTAVRPVNARHHAEETTWSALWEQGEPVPVEEARLSTTYDADGRTRRAGLELWPAAGEGDADWARRGAGELLCAASLDLGALRRECAFLRWHIEGQPGIGRYEIVRRSVS
jgi:hypothetical protein